MSAPRTRLSVAEAEALIAAALPRWDAVRVPLPEAAGGILREPVVAERDQPPFDRVTMDGIAVAHADLVRGGPLRVAGTQAAGAPPVRLPGPGTCIEVMTGSGLPEGTDTVVPVERTRREGESVRLEPGYAAARGQFIHRRASDHAAGAALLAPGTRLGPAEIAVLTVGGHADVAIARRPRVAVVSTGDELVPPGAPIQPWQVRSSNDLALQAALRRHGAGDVQTTLLPDDPAVLEREIGRLYEASDVLVLSGGVSMGQFDHVPAVLARLGVATVFHKILQRPGMPMWFGTGAGRPVFALPGNPVSSLVCLVRYVLPALAHAQGAVPQAPRPVALGTAVNFAPDLAYFLPVVLRHAPDGRTTAEPRPTNTSGDFAALAGTDGFVELARGQDHFPAGHAAPFHAW